MKIGARLTLGSSLVFCLALAPLVLATEYTFRRVTGASGGPGTVDGYGSSARFNAPSGIAIGPDGELYIADYANELVRVMTAGDVRTLAGNATIGDSLDGRRSAARFSGPNDVAVDSRGNVFVVERNGRRIRRITPGGYVSTFAGNGSSGFADGTGEDARFMSLRSIAIDASDNLYVTDAGAHTIRKITPAAVVTTWAGLGGVPGSDDLTGTNARFRGPEGIAVTPEGVVYVADTQNHTIRRISLTRQVSTLAGTAGSPGYVDANGSEARFYAPTGIAFRADYLVVADSVYSIIRQVNVATAEVSTVAGSSSIKCTGADGVYFASFCSPQDVAIDSAGNVYVADRESHVIRKIAPGSIVTTVGGLAAKRGTANGTLDGAEFSRLNAVVEHGDEIYVTDDNAVRLITRYSNEVATIAGDVNVAGWNDALGTNARFNNLTGMVFDSQGNLFLCDSGNNMIRKIDSSLNVTTFAGALTPGTADGTGTNARFNYPSWITIDANDNLYVSDTGNYTIRKITPAGVVTTFVGQAGVSGTTDGAGASALLYHPDGITCCSAGNLFVNDYTTVRRITLDGAVTTTIAGVAGMGGERDGVGSGALFSALSGIASMPDGTLFVTNGNIVRRISPAAEVETIGSKPDAAEGTAEGTGAVAGFTTPKGIFLSSDELLIVHLRRLTSGTPRVAEEATIDAAQGPAGVARTLSALNGSLSGYHWSLVRQPAGTSAVLATPDESTTLFTPDVPDRYVFRLYALEEMSDTASITDVQLDVPCPLLTLGPAELTMGVLSIPYNQALSAANGFAPYRWELTSGSLPTGITYSASGSLTGTPSSAGTYTFTVLAEDRYGCRAERTYSLTITNGPRNLTATGGASSVALTWSAVPSATGYKVFRKSAGTEYVQIGTPPAATYNDTNVVSNAAYVYYVKAVASGDSGASNRDLATTHVFADDPLVAGSTVIRLTHLNQLRAAVNSVRQLAGLSTLPMTAETKVLRTNVTSLRTALDETFGPLQIPAVSWIDTITAGTTPVRATHFTQLRNAVK